MSATGQAPRSPGPGPPIVIARSNATKQSAYPPRCHCEEQRGEAICLPPQVSLRGATRRSNLPAPPGVIARSNATKQSHFSHFKERLPRSLWSLAMTCHRTKHHVAIWATAHSLCSYSLNPYDPTLSFFAGFLRRRLFRGYGDGRG